MIRFEVINNLTILVYQSHNGNEWVYNDLNTKGSVKLNKIFTFTPPDLYDIDDEIQSNPDEPVYFIVAELEDDYFKFNTDFLSINFDLFIHKDIKLEAKMFVAEKSVSIFSVFNKFKINSLYIGGNRDNSLPEIEFENLIRDFPNYYELNRYVLARISAVIRDYIDIDSDAEEKYHRYLNKKISGIGRNLLDEFRENETYKYNSLEFKLKDMLDNEISYRESQWQVEILDIILLLYPKYIRAFTEVSIRDTYNKKNKRLDFLLVDSSGNVDIVEIKKPFGKCIVTHNKYRDNFIPLRELSGTVMQVEKYIFYLNKWGKKGEDTLTNRYKNELPGNFSIKIINPGGIIIMGRENNLSGDQKNDFEVIKRKYKNVIDIITYDELLNRLRVKIEQLGKRT